MSNSTFWGPVVVALITAVGIILGRKVGQVHQIVNSAATLSSQKLDAAPSSRTRERRSRPSPARLPLPPGYTVSLRVRNGSIGDQLQGVSLTSLVVPSGPAPLPLAETVVPLATPVLV